MLRRNGAVSCDKIVNMVRAGNLDVILAICSLMSLSDEQFPIALYRVVDSLLQSSQEQLVIAGLAALKGGHNGEWESTRRLIQTAETGMNTYVRSYALSMAADSGNMHCVSRICQLLSNKNENELIRGAAAEALAGFHDSAALTTLRAALSDESAEVRFWVCYSLGQLQDSASLSVLIWHAQNDYGVSKQWGYVHEEAARAMKYIQQGLVDEASERSDG